MAHLDHALVEKDMVKKRVAKLLRRAANRLDPPRPTFVNCRGVPTTGTHPPVTVRFTDERNRFD